MILPSLSFNKDEECDIWIIINIHISNLGMLIIIIIIFCKQSFTTFRKSLSHILKTKISNYTFERLKLWFRHKIRVPSADIFGFIFFFFGRFLSLQLPALSWYSYLIYCIISRRIRYSDEYVHPRHLILNM